MNNYYFQKAYKVSADSLKEALVDYRAHLKKVSTEHEDDIYKNYHLLYYEIINGYLETDQDLQFLIENIVQQIHTRLPWCSGSSKEALGVIGAELSLMLERYSFGGHL